MHYHIPSKQHCAVLAPWSSCWLPEVGSRQAFCCRTKTAAAVSASTTCHLRWRTESAMLGASKHPGILTSDCTGDMPRHDTQDHQPPNPSRFVSGAPKCVPWRSLQAFHRASREEPGLLGQCLLQSSLKSLKAYARCCEIPPGVPKRARITFTTRGAMLGRKDSVCWITCLDPAIYCLYTTSACDVVSYTAK